MPVKRRRNLPSLSSVPYNIPQGNKEVQKANLHRHGCQNRQRHTSWTIEENQVKDFMPKSISENGTLGLVPERSCVSLCGMFEGDLKSPGYQSYMHDREQHNMSMQGVCGFTSRSRCNSMPVDVPLHSKVSKSQRKNTKKSRSSGGYFFEKYIKRFRSRRSPDISSDESESSESENPCETLGNSRCFDKPLDKFNSNRQDMIVLNCGTKREYYMIGENYETNDYAEPDDELYPKRYGLSSDWSASYVNPTVKSVKRSDSEFLPHSPQILPTFYEPPSPSSPPPGTVTSPLYWDDSCGFDRLTSPANTPVSNLLHDFYEANYWQYDGYNDDTLKALENLYWSNFRVTGDGEWMNAKGPDLSLKDELDFVRQGMSSLLDQFGGLIYLFPSLLLNGNRAAESCCSEKF